MPTCAVEGCYSSSIILTNLRFFRFPRRKFNNRRYQQWVEFCRNPRLSKMYDKPSHIYMCAKHFDEKEFQSAECKKLLLTALPSIPPSAYAKPVSDPFTLFCANENTGSTTSAVQDIPDTITNDTPTNVSELDINVEDLEVDKLIDDPDSPGNVSAGESTLFDCPMCCGKQFSLMDLQQHISRYIWGSLKCPVCDEVCVGLEILAVHLDEHHSDQEMTVSENSMLTNVAKSTVSSEESVNVSCGDVRAQVIEDQTIVLPVFDKERITVDKSVNGGKNTCGTEKQDKEIYVPLKNKITSPCNTFSGKNISNRSKFVKKSDMRVSSVVEQTSVAYKTPSLRHRPRLLIKNITDLKTPNFSSNSLLKTSKLNCAPVSITLQKTHKSQSSDEVSIDIIKRYAHNSGMTKTSCVPATNILDNKQRLVTNRCENCKNVSTSSQKTETHVGAIHCVNRNSEICCHKCGISFISGRPCVLHNKQFNSISDCNQSNQTQHHTAQSTACEKKS